MKKMSINKASPLGNSKIQKLLLCFVALINVPSLALAIPGNGSVSFGALDDQTEWLPGVFGDGEGSIDFGTGPNAFIVDNGLSGDFLSYFDFYDEATFIDFSYDDTYAAPQGSFGKEIWSAVDNFGDTITFYITSFDSVDEIRTPLFFNTIFFGNSDSLFVEGTGFLVSSSGNSARVNAEIEFSGEEFNAPTTTFSWSSTTSIVSDESNTVSLIVFGLASLAACRRKTA